MNAPVKLAVAASAIIVVAVASYNILPQESSIGGPSPTPIRSQPTPTDGSVPIPEGKLAAGRYSLRPSTDHPTLTVVADIPSGWYGVPSRAMAGPLGPGAPNGIGISLLAVDGLFSDPCRWDVDGSGALDQPGDVPVGPAAIDLANALQSTNAYGAWSKPSPFALGGYRGYEMEILVAPVDVDLATCDKDEDGIGRYLVFSGKDAGLYAQGKNDYWLLYILDIDGARLVVVRNGYDETPVADLEAGISIIESLEFTP